MKEHNKMLGVWMSVSCYGSTPLKHFYRPRSQASKETTKKIEM